MQKQFGNYIYLLLVFISLALFAVCTAFYYQFITANDLISAEIIEKPVNVLNGNTFYTKVRHVNEDGVQMFFKIRISEILIRRFKLKVGDKILLRRNNDYSIVVVDEVLHGPFTDVLFTFFFSVFFLAAAFFAKIIHNAKTRVKKINTDAGANTRGIRITKWIQKKFHF